MVYAQDEGEKTEEGGQFRTEEQMLEHWGAVKGEVELCCGLVSGTRIIIVGTRVLVLGDVDHYRGWMEVIALLIVIFWFMAMKL